MRRLTRVTDTTRLRARRWDALVVGSGVSALVAAARLGSAGHRVLVVEEDATRALHPALREPFFLAGSRDHGALDACIRELSIPLLDRRRLSAERLAYQVTGPGLRLDVGGPDITSDEIARWGLCDAEEAAALVRTLAEATEAEKQVMLKSPLVRLSRRLGRSRTGTTGSHMRGLPAEVARAGPSLQPVLDAQVSALSNLATGDVSPEARARLLGCALAGGAGFGDGPPWLVGLLRKRVEEVHGEFRSVAKGFSLVSVENRAGHPDRGHPRNLDWPSPGPGRRTRRVGPGTRPRNHPGFRPGQAASMPTGRPAPPGRPRRPSPGHVRSVDRPGQRAE